MTRWFVGFHLNSRDFEIDRIRALVKECQCSGLIDGACYGNYDAVKYVHSYLFLAIQSEAQGTIPVEYLASFERLRKKLRLEEIGNFSELTMREFSPLITWLPITDSSRLPPEKPAKPKPAPRIKALTITKLRPQDPYSYSESSGGENLTTAYSFFLYWLSAFGRGAWQQFRTGCSELGLDPDGDLARRVARRLRLLGHLEMLDNGRAWIVAPSCLVQMYAVDGRYHTFLAGQRSQKLVDSLFRQSVPVDSHPHPRADAPEIIQATFSDEVEAKAFASEHSQQGEPLWVVGLASMHLASVLPEVDQWEAEQPELPIVKGYYNYLKWESGQFVEVHLPHETGLYQLTHVSDRVNHPQLTLLYDAETDIWRKGDWYGLRYRALQRAGLMCEAHYDEVRNEIGISQDFRWPEIYERALVLASGRLPAYRNGHAIFAGVSPTLAQILVSKLHATLIEYRGL